MADSWRAEIRAVELFVAWKVMVSETAADRVAASSTLFAESGGGRDHGVSTEICEEVDKLVRDEAAQCGGLAEFGAENRLKEAARC